MDKYPVKLYVYDISKGMARQMSPMLLGKQIDGIWHTGVICYDREYFFGAGGIESCLPGGTVLGPPDMVIDLGDTEIDKELFMHFIRGLAMQNFRPESYHLFEHNCNTFSNEVAMFLTGSKIPQHIQDLPADVLNSAFGRMIKPLIDSMSVRPSGGSSVSTSASTLAQSQSSDIFEPRESSDPAGSLKQPGSSPGCSQRFHTKEPVTHNKADISSAILQLKEDLKKDDSFEDSDLSQLVDMEKVLSSGQLNDLKDEHIQLLGKVLGHSLDCERKATLYPVNSLEELSPQSALELLRVMVCYEEFTGLHSGKDVLQKLITKFSSMTSDAIKVDTIHLLCNAVSHKTGHTNLLTTADTSPHLCSAAVTSLLEADDPLQRSAAELTFNMSRFEVNEDVAMECSTAVIEVLTRAPSKPTVRHCLYALRNFGEYNPEVLTLAHVMGVDPATYKGEEEDVDRVCQDLQKLMT